MKTLQFGLILYGVAWVAANIMDIRDLLSDPKPAADKAPVAIRRSEASRAA